MIADHPSDADCVDLLVVAPSLIHHRPGIASRRTGATRSPWSASSGAPHHHRQKHAGAAVFTIVASTTWSTKDQRQK
jgi:hypothetical protein